MNPAADAAAAAERPAGATDQHAASIAAEPQAPNENHWESGRGPLSAATWGWFAALLGWTTLLCFYRLDADVGFTPIDCWVAQTAREMHAAGDYVVPRFSGETRMQKSPGPYWAVILASLARGQPIDEVSARVPSAIAAVVLVATIFWLSRRIAGDRAAIFAGFAASSSAMILHWSHRGASDLGLTSLLTLSLACLWVAAADEPPGRRRTLLFLGGYFAAGVAMLYKMPMPLVCVGLPAFLYLLIRNRWSVLASRWHLLGLALFLLPWLPWAIAVLMQEPTALAKWRTEFLDRFTGELPNVQEQRRWYFYLLYLVAPLVECLPFSLSLVPALVRSFRPQPGANRDGTIFLLIWFFSLFAFFTASTGKELRYLLPAIPPLIVLLGIELAAFFDPLRRWTPQRDRWGAVGVWIGVPAVFALGIVVLRRWFKDNGQNGLVEWPTLLVPYLVVAAIFITGTALAAWLYIRRRENASFAALVATMWIGWLVIWPELMPIVVSRKPYDDFARQVHAKLPPELLAPGRLRNVGFQDSRIIWYGDFRFPRVIDQLELLRRQQGRRSRETEERLIGEEMVNRLSADEPCLLVASRFDYVYFREQAGKALAADGRVLPDTWLWIQTGIGPPDSQFVVFGNRPPPWPAPALHPPSERLKAAEREIEKLLAASNRPPRHPTSPPSAPAAGSD